MYLSATCPTCKTNYRIGNIDSLPYPSQLTVTLADLLHGHVCKPVDKNVVDRSQLVA